MIDARGGTVAAARGVIGGRDSVARFEKHRRLWYDDKTLSLLCSFACIGVRDDAMIFVCRCSRRVDMEDLQATYIEPEKVARQVS